jgi:Family of unknown function (DUF6496)
VIASREETVAKKETEAQSEVVERVMHEFKEGKLERGHGGKVTNPKQAIAIALSEAGASNQQSPAENRKRLGQTKAKERASRRSSRDGDETRAQLYAEATRKGVRGRSRMTKAELRKAVRG